MVVRHDIVSKFCSYACFAEGKFQRWVLKARLKAEFEKLLAQSEEKLGEVFWSLYWFKRWQERQERIAQAHLEAYLQEPCYWAAKTFLTHVEGSNYSLADCFQMAAMETVKVLQHFQPAVGQHLAKYAQYSFANLLRETFRCQGEVDICTDWALLRKISEKTLRAALSQHSTVTIESLVLCWKTFKQVYVPKPGNTRKLETPDAETLGSLVQIYNSRILTASLSLSRLRDGSTALLWLQKCATAVRQYLHPAVTSLNIPLTEEGGELQDQLPDPQQTEDLTEVLIQLEAYQEREWQKQELKNCLTTTIANLPQESQQILAGYYQHHWTQKQLSEKLQLSQPTINRRLQKARQTLLQSLVTWLQQTMNITPSADILKSSADLLEEWLDQYYGATL
ncbi:MAG: sigma-70 family RNA polymerase sigma factor [Pseudanabaenaceae cyanobacterium]